MSNDNRMEEKLDKLDNRLDSIDTTLTKNTVLLDEHIKRTNLLEQQFVPVRRHVEVVNFLAKAIIALIPVLATIRVLFF